MEALLNPSPDIMLQWVLRIFNFIDKHDESINGLSVFNDTSDSFGRNYYEIYIRIDAKKHFMSCSLPFAGTRELSEEDKKENEIFRDYYWLGERCAFYANYFEEVEVAKHYSWLVALVKNLQRGSRFTLDIRDFKTEQRLRQERRKEWEVQEAINNCNFIGNPGDVALVKDNSGNERLIELDRLNITKEYPYSGCEIRTNLQTGKVRVDYIAEESILAFLPKKEFEKFKKDKAILRRDQFVERIKILSKEA
jgi:hypothetical protein